MKKFHHIGIACKNIEESFSFLSKVHTVMSRTETIFDPLQNVNLCMVTVEDGTKIELVSGSTVESFIKKRDRSLY